MRLIIYRSLLLTVAVLAGFFIIAMRMGGAVPEDFVDSKIPSNTLRADDWRIYDQGEWGQLAFRFLGEGQLGKAEYAAKQALAANPGYGVAAAALMQTYSRQRLNDKAEEMFQLSSRLWPARHKHLFEKKKQ